MIPATGYGRPFRRVDAHPFTPDRSRPLRVVLDDATLSDEQIALFNLFAEEEEIEVWHTEGDRLPLLELGEPFETPFLVAGALSVYGTSERSENMFGIYGTERMAARAAELAEAGEGAADEILRALQFAAASDEMEADAFITERTSVSARGQSDPVVVSPADGFALIGLALRAHGNTSIGRDLRYNRPGSSFFHFLLGRELLRESWPWFGGVVAYGEVHRDDESTGYLAQTGLERFQRVLQIRDRLHIAAKGEPTSTRFDEATFELETLLLFLSATFDATARVAHLIYLGGSYEEAGWRRGPWLDRLAGRAPDLAAAVAEESHGATLLQILGALRNTIHGESMRAAIVQQGGQTSRFIRLPAREEERLRQRIGSLGDDLDEWGLQDDHGRLQLVSDRFVERLISESVRLLNQLMGLTDTSLLPGAAGSPFRAPLEDRKRQASNERLDWFSSEVRARVRLLGGVDA